MSRRDGSQGSPRTIRAIAPGVLRARLRGVVGILLVLYGMMRAPARW